MSHSLDDPGPRRSRPRGPYRASTFPPRLFFHSAVTSRQHVRRSGLFVLLVPLMLGCRAKSKTDAGGGEAAPAPASVARMRAGIAPVLVADSAGLRHYLETVDTVRGATFDVTWSPNSVRLTRDQTLRSLRRVSRDGATFTFASGDPAIAGLKPGQILLVWGIALRKVTAVEPQGAAIVVRTDLVPLPEAIPNGRIEWRSQVSFAQGLVSPKALPPDTASKRSSLPWPAAGIFRFASYHQGEGQGGGPEGGADAEAELPHHSGGEIGDYEYEIGFANEGNRLDFQLEVRKGEGEGPFKEPGENQGERSRAHGTQSVGANGGFDGERHGAALTNEEKKQKKEHEEQDKNTRNGVNKPETPADILTPKGLFGIANELLDLRVRVRGHLDGFGTSGSILLTNAKLGNFKGAVENLHGDADLDWIARLGERGIFSEKVKLEVPFNYDIPLIIGGLPFVVEVGANLLLTPGLTSRHATATGSYHITFDGTTGISATPNDAKTEGSLSGTAEDTHHQVTTLGVSAILVAAQVPRIGFGLGLLNSSAVAFIDHVLSTSVVSAGATALIPCRRFEIFSTFGAGVGVQILGIPVPGVGSKHQLKEPFHKVVTEPEGLNCKVAGE